MWVSSSSSPKEASFHSPDKGINKHHRTSIKIFSNKLHPPSQTPHFDNYMCSHYITFPIKHHLTFHTFPSLPLALFSHDHEGLWSQFITYGIKNMAMILPKLFNEAIGTSFPHIWALKTISLVHNPLSIDSIITYCEICNNLDQFCQPI